MPRLTKRKQAAVDREIRKKIRRDQSSVVHQVTEDLQDGQYIRDSSFGAPGGPPAAREVSDLPQFTSLPTSSPRASFSDDLYPTDSYYDLEKSFRNEISEPPSSPPVTFDTYNMTAAIVEEPLEFEDAIESYDYDFLLEGIEEPYDDLLSSTIKPSTTTTTESQIQNETSPIHISPGNEDCLTEQSSISLRTTIFTNEYMRAFNDEVCPTTILAYSTFSDGHYAAVENILDACGSAVDRVDHINDEFFHCTASSINSSNMTDESVATVSASIAPRRTTGETNIIPFQLNNDVNDTTDVGLSFELSTLSTSTRKPIRLTRSKTTVVEILGASNDQTSDPDADCHCDACLKWIEFNKCAKPQVPLSCDSQDTSTAIINPQNIRNDEMKTFYQQVGKVTLKRRFINRSEDVPEAGLTERTEPKPVDRTTTKRFQAIDTDAYTTIEIPQWKSIEGRRIVDYNYFMKWLLVTQASHSQECVGILCPYQEDFKSMVSTVFLKCNICNEIYKGSSEEPSEKKRLRLSLVWGILCSGGTYTQAHELFSFLNMPFLSRKTFIKDEASMDNTLEAALQKSIEKAVDEEKELALDEMTARGITHVEGTPIKACAALDGSWGQRSNGHRYNSASGCAAIVSTRTKKVCFIGCRNKRCVACNKNVQRKKKGLKVHKHKCYRNFKGASGGMEPAIVIDGFKKLLHKGIKFTTVVTDGDSTTVARLKNDCKYGHEIRQQLCCNHAIKSCGKKLREIKCPKQYLSQFKKSIDRTTRGMRAAIKHCADETDGEDVEGLRQDIRNAPFHAFGVHDDCRSYFCTKNNLDETGSDAQKCIVPELQKLGIWDKVLVAVEKLAAKAEFLCENRTSNLVENLFCRLSKYNVGKRVDTMSRGSYQRRVYITALQHNESFSWQDEYMHIYTGDSPGFYMRKMISEKTNSSEHNRKTQNQPGFSRRKPTSYDDIEIDYGEEAVAAVEEAHAVFNLSEMEENYKVAENTMNAFQNDLSISQMEEYCQGRILTKYVPEVINSRDSTKLKKCETLLLNTNIWNFLKSNRSIIGLILRQLKDANGFKMGGTKMFIDLCHSYLCCVPDAISEDGTTILLLRKRECKVAISEIASKPGNTLGCKLKNGKIELDKNATIEVQTAMHVCNVPKCLMIFVNSGNHTDYLLKELDYDEVFFRNKVQDKLTNFFETYFAKAVYLKNISIKS